MYARLLAFIPPSIIFVLCLSISGFYSSPVFALVIDGVTITDPPALSPLRDPATYVNCGVAVSKLNNDTYIATYQVSSTDCTSNTKKLIPYTTYVTGTGFRLHTNLYDRIAYDSGTQTWGTTQATNSCSTSVTSGCIKFSSTTNYTVSSIPVVFPYQYATAPSTNYGYLPNPFDYVMWWNDGATYAYLVEEPNINPPAVTAFEVLQYSLDNYEGMPGKHDFEIEGSFSEEDVSDEVDVCVLDVFDSTATYKRYLASVFIRGVDFPSGYSISTASFPMHQTSQNYEYASGTVRDFSAFVTVQDEPYTDFKFEFDYSCYDDIKDDTNQGTYTVTTPPIHTGTIDDSLIDGTKPTEEELTADDPCNAEGLSLIESLVCKAKATLERTLYGFFMPPDDHAYIYSMYTFQQALNTHAPFAYMVPFVDFSFSPISNIPPTTSGLRFLDHQGNTVYLDLSPGTADELNPYWYIRTFFGAAVYSMLLVYFKFLYRRVLDRK